jgi:copper homeostasis protein (lipoprotein)
MASGIVVAAGVLAAAILFAVSAQAKVVTLGTSDNQTEVSLNLGDTLEVELPTDDVPGFHWVSHLPDQSALTPLDNAAAEPAANARAAKTKFRFNAAQTGDALLDFSFEPAAKIPGTASGDTSAFAVQVHVTAGAPAAGTAVLLGVYQGTMPCADCSGLDTVLRLYAHGKYDTTYAFYVRTQTYRDAPHGSVTFSDRGDWTVLRGDATDVNATVYQLNPDDQRHSDSWLAKENGASLVQLGHDLKPIRTKMNLTLRRVDE